MWPLISKKEGDWYPAGLSSTDFAGLYGYKGGQGAWGAAGHSSLLPGLAAGWG